MKVIDLFAGLGGSSEGAKQADCEVVWAGNHWGLAVETHKANHPGAAHVCQDLQQANWAAVPEHDLMLASPCCQGHSKAKGKARPDHDASRSTAWAPIACLEFHSPEFFIVENVPEFLNWNLYRPWKMCLEAMGYAVQTISVNSADAGVAQLRPRMLIVGNKGKAAIDLKMPTAEHKTARSVLDFESGSWSQVNKPGRAAATLARVANGRKQHGDQFLFSYYGNTTGGRSLDRPIGVITTKERWALVDGDRMRMITLEEARQFMGFPSDYKLAKTKKDSFHLLGNAVVPAEMTRTINAIKAA